MNIRRTSLTITLLAVVVFAGCDRVTRDNYEKIETGMTMDEVVEILGEPTELTSVGFGPLEVSTARWEGKKGTVSIQLAGQKVRIKRFLTNEESEDNARDDE